jgi:outer membrane protein assembly factor BamC
MKPIFSCISVLWFAPLILLSACSSQPEYLEATSLPVVKLPAATGKERLGQLYPIPEAHAPKPDQFTVPYPPTVGIQDDANIASVQTMDNQLWILNAKSPASTWSQLMTFFQQRQIAIMSKELSTATIDTNWIKEAVQPGFFTRYRLRLEQGLQPNTTEIYLANERKSEAMKDIASTNWPDTLQDGAHGKWLAKELVTTLNNPKLNVGDSYLATTINLPQKVLLTNIDKEPVLSIKAGQGRLNRAFDKALDNNGLIIYASTDSIYHINQYKVKEKKSSWYNPLSWGANEKPDKKSSYSLDEILAHLPNEVQVNDVFTNLAQRQGAKKLSGVGGYLLVQRQLPESTLIYVRDGYGRRLKVTEARNLLDTIRLRLL